MIKYVSKYISREVLDQVYKLYIRPHFVFGDTIYHKFDPNMNSQQSLSKFNNQWLWRSLVRGGVQADRDFMMNWDGKPCITEDGIKAYVISFL